MTKKKVIGRPFKKGNNMGKGRPKMTNSEKNLTDLTRTKFKCIVRKYLKFNKEQLGNIAKDRDTPALDLMVLSVMNKAIQKGDEKKMNWFLEQLFGKEQNRVDLTSNGETIGFGANVKKVVLKLPENGRTKEEN